MNDFYATSPQRYSFQWDLHKQKLEEGKISKETYNEFSNLWSSFRDKDAIPSSDLPCLENELRSSKEISNKCKASKVYSQNLYAALCNNEFIKDNKVWGCSWRHSGGIIANLREEGDYIDWYCSGIGEKDNYVGEGEVAPEIKDDILKLGWTIKLYEDKTEFDL